MQSSTAGSNQRVQEISLIDLASIFIRFKGIFFAVLLFGVLCSVVVSQIISERYQYTTLMELAEKETGDPIETPESLLAWLQYSLLPTEEIGYRREYSRNMPFEVDVDIPADTLLLKLTSRAEEVDETVLKEIHQSVVSRIAQRQKRALDRHLRALNEQLSTTNETIELLRTMEDPGSALSDSLDRQAEIKRKIVDVREASIISVAQQSLEKVSKGPVFVIVIGIILSGILASIVTLVWALFSYARKCIAEH
ncbi:hypothetical protein KUV44_08380 [Marinobacter daepoensis]|uniref:Lipopolysaccharide biosynthesis protein n=1 Tax=Marinobacter daepoensis TaxID=262077 RepID=A0ABS3BHJ7_9GAMM|nr:hypothetical protein [Marinobacter daepoensis]MBN7771289.1 hypothetical protein [Marinobacter daepoensis]MBY6079151.1 hypothetical protein [Marinobacter daepoensis]